MLCAHISARRNILNYLQILLFLLWLFLINFNNTYNISNISHKTKSPFLSIVVALTEPKKKHVLFLIFVKYLLTDLM